MTDELWPIAFTPFHQDGRLDLDALDPLVAFYLREGATGLFFLGATGEVHELSASERAILMERVVPVVAGRCPVAATADPASSLAGQATAVRARRDQGVDIPVILLSHLPGPAPHLEALLQLAEGSNGFLGLYESFGPRRHILTPRETRILAETDRFVFVKETSCHLPTYLAKVRAAGETPLKVLQANIERLPRSMAHGAPGFCGVVGSVFPERVVQCMKEKEGGGEAYRELLDLQSMLRTHGHPAAGKYLVSKQGVPLDPACRKARGKGFGPADREALDRFFQASSLAR